MFPLGGHATTVILTNRMRFGDVDYNTYANYRLNTGVPCSAAFHVHSVDFAERESRNRVITFTKSLTLWGEGNKIPLGRPRL